MMPFEIIMIVFSFVTGGMFGRDVAALGLLPAVTHCLMFIIVLALCSLVFEALFFGELDLFVWEGIVARTAAAVIGFGCFALVRKGVDALDVIVGREVLRTASLVLIGAMASIYIGIFIHERIKNKIAAKKG